MTLQTGLSVPEGHGIDYSTAVDIARTAGSGFIEVLFDGRVRLESVKPQIHLNDTRGSADGHRPLGAGTVDFEPLFVALGAEWTGRLCVGAIVRDPVYFEQSLSYLETLLPLRQTA